MLPINYGGRHWAIRYNDADPEPKGLRPQTWLNRGSWRFSAHWRKRMTTIPISAVVDYRGLANSKPRCCVWLNKENWSVCQLSDYIIGYYCRFENDSVCKTNALVLSRGLSLQLPHAMPSIRGWLKSCWRIKERWSLYSLPSYCCRCLWFTLARYCRTS